MQAIRWETPSRYYAARVYQDLLGYWIVESSWGGLGNNLGSSKQEVVPSYTDAVQVMLNIHRRRKSRRYGIVSSK